MSPFKGFPDGKTANVPIPAAFFSDLLPLIDHLGELKVTLHAFRLLEDQDAPVRYLTPSDFFEDADLAKSFSLTTEEAQALILNSLELACQRGTLLFGEYNHETLYFLNSPRSKAALLALKKGAWSPDDRDHLAGLANHERPNIYQLYEQNIGPLTPILAETLQEAERDYPTEWIEEAVGLAVKKNVRNWNYVQAILRSWKEKGRNEADQRNNKENPRRYIEGDLADYIKH